MKDSIDKILQTIDEAINSFQDKMPGLQKLIFDELQPIIKDLKIQNGKLLANVENLKLLGQLKNKLQKIIINPEYKKAVQKFIDSYDALSTLNIDYFKQFNQKFTPAKTLPIIKQLAIESTINDLVGQGMNVNIVDSVADILNRNITTGGSYASLQEQLRSHLLNDDTGDGSLVKYTKQITVDAINQYHAQYHAAIAQDLQFTWGRYVGSLLTTSRQFCILLTKKEWVHKNELPDIIKGVIDGKKCTLSKTTGLPLGMIPGTNQDNFKINRGGYKCGHHYFEVPDSAVPESVKAPKIYKIGITNATESNVDAIIGDKIVKARKLESEGNFDEADKIFSEILQPAKQRLSDKFRDLREISVDVKDTKGNFSNTSEPTLETIITDTDFHRNEIIKRVAELGQDFNQEAVHVSEIFPTLPKGMNFGEQLPDGSVFEPNFEIRFDHKLSGPEINKLNTDIQSGGLAGSTLHSDNKGLTLYNISNWKPYQQFNEEVATVIKGLHSGGVQLTFEENVRKIWNIGKSSGPGFVNYKQAEGISGEVFPKTD